jgi:hypothetical protein
VEDYPRRPSSAMRERSRGSTPLRSTTGKCGLYACACVCTYVLEQRFLVEKISPSVTVCVCVCVCVCIYALRSPLNFSFFFKVLYLTNETTVCVCVWVCVCVYLCITRTPKKNFKVPYLTNDTMVCVCAGRVPLRASYNNTAARGLDRAVERELTQLKRMFGL